MTEVGETTGDRGGGQTVAQEAQQTARRATEQVTEKAQEMSSKGRSTLEQQVDKRSGQVAEQVRSYADALRGTSEELRNQGREQPAQFAETAAQRADRLAGYLEQANADRVLHDVEDFARRRPWAVAAGGAALGFLSARFLKASSGERYRKRSQQQRALTTEAPPPLPASPVAGAPGTIPTEASPPGRLDQTGTV